MARQDLNELFARTSFLHGANAGYIEDLYARYQDNPTSVGEQWRAFFADLKDGAEGNGAVPGAPSWKRSDWPPQTNGELVAAMDGDWASVEQHLGQRIQGQAQSLGVDLTGELALSATRDSVRALMMIRAYRVRGHLAANLDPLGLERKEAHPELDPASYGFTGRDLDRNIYLDQVLGMEFGTVRQIIEILRRTYCSTIGVEFMHISSPDQKAWIQARIEGKDKEVSFTTEGKKAILNKLVEVEAFEKFLDVKYTGTKRFGLDGGESTVPALEQIIKRGGHLGVQDIILGMPHRGRLNVLANVMGKPFRAIFNEFKGGSANPDDVEGSGDVKYHLGASSDREFDGNNVHLSLTATRRISKSSIRSCSARCARSRTSCATRRVPRCCRCCCTAMRPLPARVSSRNVSACPGWRATAPAARSISTSTIRSVSPRHRITRDRRPILQTSRA